MTRFDREKAFSEGFIPAIKTIVGPYLLEPATVEMDQQQATDLIVLRANGVRVACRIRRHNYFPRFGNEFTVRSRLMSGTKTEEQKILEGWADWMFYAFAAPDSKTFLRWFLIDLDAFRTHWRTPELRQHISHGEIENVFSDGSFFRWYSIPSFVAHPPILIAQSKPPETLPDWKDSAVNLTDLWK